MGLEVKDLGNVTRNKFGDILESRNFSRNLPEKINDDMPRLVYIARHDWETRAEDDSKIPVKIPNNEFIYANDEFFHTLMMESQGITASNAILCLAAVGLNLILPNVSLDMIAEEEIEKIRTDLQEERVSYLNAITEIADETYERFKEKEFSEIMRWAEDEVTFKLLPKARCLEDSILKLDKQTLNKAGLKLWKDGVPVITSAYMSGGMMSAAKVSVEETLKIISHILQKRSNDRHLPQIAYAAKICHALSNK